MAAHGRSAGLCKGTARGCAWAQRGVAQRLRHSTGLHRRAAWGRVGKGAGARLCRGAAQGGERDAVWGCAEAQRRATQGRSVWLRVYGHSAGLRGGAARRRASKRCVAVHGHRVQLRKGVAWGRAGTRAESGAAQGRNVLLRRDKGTARSCAWAQRGPAHGPTVGLRRGAAWGCTGV